MYDIEQQHQFRYVGNTYFLTKAIPLEEHFLLDEDTEPGGVAQDYILFHLYGPSGFAEEEWILKNISGVC